MNETARADQLDALELLARMPIRELPRLTWFATDAGTLVGSPPHGRGARQAFTAWARHLGLTPDPERGVCTVRLRAQGRVEGVLVTLWAELRARA